MADPPPGVPKTFLSALTSRPPLGSLPNNPNLNPKREHLGDMACLYTEEQVQLLSSHYSNALIGKFNKGRPTMEQLESAFKTVGFQGRYQLGSIDYKHVLIRFEKMDDFQRCWIKGLWIFNGKPMKVLRWTPDFSPHTESSIVPLWVTIYDIPIFFYNMGTIEDVGNTIGSYIKMDAATEGMTRPSAIKICVEFDLLKPLKSVIRLGTEKNHVKCRIEYENVPFYCTFCSRIGHSDHSCKFYPPDQAPRTTPGIGQEPLAISPRWKPTGNLLSHAPSIFDDRINDKIPPHDAELIPVNANTNPASHPNLYRPSTPPEQTDLIGSTGTTDVIINNPPQLLIPTVASNTSEKLTEPTPIIAAEAFEPISPVIPVQAMDAASEIEASETQNSDTPLCCWILPLKASLSQ